MDGCSWRVRSGYVNMCIEARIVKVDRKSVVFILCSQSPKMKICITTILRMGHAMLARDWTYSLLAGRLHTGVLVHLLLVVTDRGLCDGADVALLRVRSAGVIWWQHSSSGAHHRADLVVHGLRLGLLDDVLEGGAGCRDGRCGVWERNRRVLEEVVVVVGGRAYNGAGLEVWLVS